MEPDASRVAVSRKRKQVGSIPDSDVPSSVDLSDEDRISLLSHQEEDEFRSEDEGSEEDEPPPKKRFKPSEETLGYLKSSASKPLKNDKRRTILGKFPMLAADAAHPPKLDDSVACLVQSHDNFLSKLQRFTMDAMTPLTWALNELENNKEVNCSSVLRASV